MEGEMWENLNNFWRFICGFTGKRFHWDPLIYFDMIFRKIDKTKRLKKFILFKKKNLKGFFPPPENKNFS